MQRYLCIHQLVVGHQPDATALTAAGRQAATFRHLQDQLHHTVGGLRQLGIQRDDRVAIVLPNGPLAASAFLSIAVAATTAPLNPTYTEEEYEFYLSDLEAKLLVVQAGLPSPARRVAERLGVAVAEVHENGDVAGLFHFDAVADAVADSNVVEEDFPEAEDTALILHTSGTTSRPKMVPLTHRNLCISAANVTESLGLSADDRCLNIMPLFHIHGLVAAVLASLAVGASVVCTPGFNALKFYSWLEESKATWYTAVPTMHQAILDRAPRNAAVIEKARLRFVRSSSASLPPQVMRSLEETFGAPVIEAYGMTEAAHQMTSNPLPPRKRKPGAVGLAAGLEVEIMDEDGNLLPRGSIGEVVIRGDNVTAGYVNNEEANATAFTADWFRTGDQGILDEEDYLRLTGRLKEIINRGGEKISPREVDEVLLDHPAVSQVVTFAMPHQRLGEEVAAALVLNPGQTATQSEVRAFARQKLAAFKVPRKLVFLEEIPKGPTGKLQRIGLAKKLGLG